MHADSIVEQPFTGVCKATVGCTVKWCPVLCIAHVSLSAKLSEGLHHLCAALYQKAYGCLSWTANMPEIRVTGIAPYLSCCPVHCCVTLLISSFRSTTLVEQELDNIQMSFQRGQMKRSHSRMVGREDLDIVVDQPLWSSAKCVNALKNTAQDSCPSTLAHSR